MSDLVFYLGLSLFLSVALNMIFAYTQGEAFTENRYLKKQLAIKEKQKDGE